jgi:membrane protein implicated in regulation of membrane protease activity
MSTVYLVCLIVGGFFVLLSLLGGADSDADVDADANVDFNADADLDTDVDAHAEFAHDVGTGVGFVDLLSLRFVFLFAAFFGLSGTLLDLIGSNDSTTLVMSLLMGLVVGLGGNYFIKTVGYRAVSSEVTADDLIGHTGRVMVPFGSGERGKVRLVSKGKQVVLIARSLDDTDQIEFMPGEEVVVVRLDGSIAEVVKPD